jgi:hypothetical protein
MPTPSRRLEGRDGRIWRAYLLGTTQEALAAQEGLSQTRISEIVSAARAAIPEADLAQARTDHLDAMRTLAEVAADIMEAPLSPAYSNGRIMLDENGRAILDAGPRLAALDRLVKINERVAKVMGLDAPVKADVTVTEAANRKSAEAAAAAMSRLHGGDDA